MSLDIWDRLKKIKKKQIVIIILKWNNFMVIDNYLCSINKRNTAYNRENFP